MATVPMGHRIGRLPNKSKRFSMGRVCSHPGCPTRLSIYNPQDRCSVHNRFSVPRLRGRTVRHMSG